MNNEFKELAEVMKAISEQNKGLERLDEKIKEVIVAYLKELKIDNFVDEIPSINLSDLKLDEINNKFSDKVSSLEQENSELKEKLIILENSLNENNLFYKKLEEKLNLLEENNKITSDIEVSNVDGNDLSNNNLAVKKDGKVVNIVINVWGCYGE